MTRDLINLENLNKSDFLQIFNFADKAIANKHSNKILNKKNVGLIFENLSTRTRLSFQSAIFKLGGNPIEINLTNLNFNKFESFIDTVQMFNCYLDAIVYRTTEHQKLILTKKYFHKPLINALSEISHPCQTLTDLFTIRQHYGNLKQEICWFGDINNVLYGLIESTKIFKNLRINIFSSSKIIEKNKYLSKNSSINLYSKLDFDVIKRSKVIMTDVYISMNDKSSKEKEKSLLRFQVNKNIMNMTSDDAVFMHCLPALIGKEVTDDVIRGHKSITIKQAKNRMYVQMGLLEWLNI